MLIAQVAVVMAGLALAFSAGPLWVVQVRRVITGDEYIPLHLILSAVTLTLGLSLTLGGVLWLLST